MSRNTAPAAGMNIISLGAGVQSTTMLLMAMAGEIEPMPDCAIFADTGWEPKAVYDHLAWLESVSTIPIHRVSAGNIRDGHVMDQKATHRATMPLHVIGDRTPHGMLKRDCTTEYKVRPIQRQVRLLNGRKPTVTWLGISLDEIQRMKPSRVKYIEHRWPLVEQRLTRNDCLAWLKRRNYPHPPKSACIGCPFRSNDQWRALSPAEFADAVAFDESVRIFPKVRGKAFLHASLLPLDMVDLRTEQEKGQLDLWGNECEGMCGL